jgi:hypothetical protein
MIMLESYRIYENLHKLLDNASYKNTWIGYKVKWLEIIEGWVGFKPMNIFVKRS